MMARSVVGRRRPDFSGAIPVATDVPIPREATAGMVFGADATKQSDLRLAIGHSLKA